MSRAIWVWFQQGADTLDSPLAHLHGTEPVSGPTLALLKRECSLKKRKVA